VRIRFENIRYMYLYECFSFGDDILVFNMNDYSNRDTKLSDYLILIICKERNNNKLRNKDCQMEI
jgi:hypothetical protein